MVLPTHHALNDCLMTISPFKFLDAYQRDDSPRFFGREKETAQLYNAVFASNLTLLYGASGTGKSSIINCGLGNKFYDTDWLPLQIRRGDNINESLSTAILGHLKVMTAATDAAPNNITKQLLELYQQQYKPIYLIFDQFEELYILGNRTEQEIFYQTVTDILKSGLQAKLLISIREEWIAYLNDFEKVVPALFENRLRIERMNEQNLKRVIYGSIKTAEGVAIELIEPVSTINLILDNIRDQREGIDLTNLQVYLDRLFRKDLERQGVPETNHCTFDEQLVKNIGPMKNVLSDFIDEQIEKVEMELSLQGYDNPRGVPLEILFTLATDDGTKQALTVEGILEQLPANRKVTKEQVEFCLAEFERIKILRPVE